MDYVSYSLQDNPNSFLVPQIPSNPNSIYQEFPSGRNDDAETLYFKVVPNDLELSIFSFPFIICFHMVFSMVFWYLKYQVNLMEH